MPAVSTLTSGVGIFTVTLKTAGSQNVTARDIVATGLSATTGSITVSAAAVAHFAFTGTPSSLTAGTGFGFTVTAQDAFNNTVFGYSGTVVFSSSDMAAVFVPASGILSAGQGTFSVTLKTAGNQTLIAQDKVTSTVAGASQPIAVHAAQVTHYLIAGTPSSLTAGTPFAFTVTADDAFNNTVSGYTGTVRFSSNDTGATLPPASTLTAGVGTFSATLVTAGSRTLTATDTVTSSIAASSSPIAVLAGAATHFSVNAPSTLVAGQLLVFTVTSQDRFNNTAPSYTGTADFTTTQQPGRALGSFDLDQWRGRLRRGPGVGGQSDHFCHRFRDQHPHRGLQHHRRHRRHPAAVSRSPALPGPRKARPSASR